MLKIIFLLVMLASFSAEADPKTNDFDVICDFFTELSQNPQIKKMSAEQKADFVGTRIAAKLSASSDAKTAWTAIISATPDQRYELFKSAAESILPKTWDCPAMQQYASTTGD